MKNLILAVIASAIVGGTVFYLIGKNTAPRDNGAPHDSQRVTGSADEHLQGAVVKDSSNAAGQKQVNIEINEFFFNPTQLTIAPGTTVTWINKGNIRHDVKSIPKSPMSFPGSELLSAGESYSYTFEESGTYLYICSPHPIQMRAVIIVEDSTDG